MILSTHSLPVSARLLAERCKCELFVVIDEDYGYKSWLWFPCMSATELEHWWQQQPNIESFWGRQADGTMGESQIGWPGEFFQMDEADDLGELHSRLWKSAHYKSHIDLNHVGSRERPDTFLKRSDGALFLHRGAIFD